MADEKWLTVAQVSEILQLNPATIRRWLREGRLRGVSLGSDKSGWRVAQSELARFMEEMGKAAA